MSEESERLMEHIAGLSDIDLLRMVYLDYAQYRSEAITYAKAEIAKRGVNTNSIDLNNLSNIEIPHPFITWIRRTRRFSVILILTRAYALGFLAGGFVFALLNILSYRQMINAAAWCDDCVMSFGFPLEWYSFGGFVGMTYIHWWNLAADIMAGLFICLLLGWLFKSLVEKFRSYMEPA
jgi:hypothetical protein